MSTLAWVALAILVPAALTFGGLAIRESGRAHKEQR